MLEALLDLVGYGFSPWDFLLLGVGGVGLAADCVLWVQPRRERLIAVVRAGPMVTGLLGLLFACMGLIEGLVPLHSGGDGCPCYATATALSLRFLAVGLTLGMVQLGLALVVRVRCFASGDVLRGSP